MRNRDDASMRRRLVVLLAPLLAVGVAFRRGYRPSWSFARAADYVVRKAPGERGAALRTLRDSLECDAYEVSLANRSIVLYNATLALDGSDALRLGRVAVFCDSWSPLVVSVEVANVSVLVLARDLLFLNTNWHRVAELEAALETLSPLSSSSSESVVSGVRRLEFGGVAACELTGPAGTATRAERRRVAATPRPRRGSGKTCARLRYGPGVARLGTRSRTPLAARGRARRRRRLRERRCALRHG